MSPLALIIIISWLAGFAAFVGGVTAKYEGSAESEKKKEFIHSVTAFGGGILVAAVAFALVPEGIDRLNTFMMTVAFVSGGTLFCVIDAWQNRHRGSAAQFMAMLLDFVPEAIALGAVFAGNRNLGILLAVYIGAQNLPEGFNSYREMVDQGRSRTLVLATLFGASFLGPVAACLGYYFLRDQMAWTAAIMTFAGGGILYLIFQDIAPQSEMENHWTPTLGAVFGFLVGMIGKKWIG